MSRGPWNLNTWQRRAWLWALGCFLLAGLTGVVFRFGLLRGTLPAGLAFDKLRHAHSHLMYFGWVTPSLFAVMCALAPGVREPGPGVRAPAQEGAARSRGSRHGVPNGAAGGEWPAHWGDPSHRQAKAAPLVVALTIGAALLSYPLFLLYGYEPVPVGSGSAQVPLAAIAASLNILAWYAFVWVFRGELKGADAGGRPRTGHDANPPSPASMGRSLWNSALAFLVLASFGAWGRGALNAAGVEEPFWQDAAVHLFLDVFSDGWMVLALLGAGYVVHTRRGSAPTPWAVWGRRLAVAGVPLSFLLGVPYAWVPALARAAAQVGGFLSGLGLLLMIADLARHRGTGQRGRLQWGRPDPLWTASLAALAVKAAATMLLAVPQVALWAERAGLRILYLHVLLLGGVSLGLVSIAGELGGFGALGAGARRAMAAFAGSVGLVLASLVALTGLWPEALRGPWVLQWAAWAAAVLWLSALWLSGAALFGGGEAARPSFSFRP